MIDEVKVRARKSAKYGKTYEYRFEVAPIGGARKWLSKGGFPPEKEARKAISVFLIKNTTPLPFDDKGVVFS